MMNESDWNNLAALIEKAMEDSECLCDNCRADLFANLSARVSISSLYRFANVIVDHYNA